MVGNASCSSSLSALSGMSPSSWLMDSAYCNHMTPHSSLFSELKPTLHPLNISTANGSTMSGHNIGSISTSNLLVPGIFNVPDLSKNSFSVGQLAELGDRIIFDYSGCIMQDPRTRQELGTDPRVGRMFPVDNLRCNHMTPHSSLFSELKPALHPLNISIANDSTMFGHNIGSISTSNLSVPGIFNVPDLS